MKSHYDSFSAFQPMQPRSRFVDCRSLRDLVEAEAQPERCVQILHRALSLREMIESSAIYENLGRGSDVDRDQAGRSVVGRTDRYDHTGICVARRGGIVSQSVYARREHAGRDRVSDFE